jgi:amidohydrolase
MLQRAKAIQEQLVAWRREIHQHPELGFQEVRTARMVAGALANMDIEAQTGVGKTGVVGFIGSGSPVIGIRADMDALPIQEEHDVPYASQTPGMMHACGHDAHTAMLLGAARLLSEMEDRPPGQIRLLFQPSEESSDEENKSGAIRMIEDHALDGLDAVIALHVNSDAEANRIEIVEGYASANEDSFMITILATGGHGAFPHHGTDPVHILAQVINAINGIRARRIDPIRRAAISIGSVHGGAASNVIPSKIVVIGTMRSFEADVRQQLKDELRDVLEVARALGGDFKLEFTPGYAAMFNDPAVADLMRQSVTEMMGKEALTDPEPMMGAEDFSYMSQLAPGAMFMLGAKYDEQSRSHHTPVFDINEKTLPTGAALLADIACRLLQEKAP